LSNESWFVVGLGNPGPDYKKTRHNIGFLILDEMASQCGCLLNQKKFNTEFGNSKVAGDKVILAKPMSFMNLSGLPVHSLSSYFKVVADRIIVIHDDIDLEFGCMKIKNSGGHGGHNGIRSIISALGNNNFIRVRVGVGRPDTGRNVSDFVLGKFSGSEFKELEKISHAAIEAVSTIITGSASEAMNKFNKKNILV